MAEKTRDWWRVVEIVTLLVAAISAAFSAYQSRVSIEISRTQNANAVLFQSRLEAQKQYISAYGELDTTLYLIAAEMPVTSIDLEEKSQLANLSIEQLRRAAAVAKQSISAYGHYEHSVNVARGIWPDILEKQIVHAGDDARVASSCYRTVGSPPMTSEELALTRKNLQTSCASLHVKVSDFRDASNAVVYAMLTETRASLAGVGANRSGDSGVTLNDE
jgi:hypothetical protein